MSEAPLNQKQETFVREYLIDLNGTQAAIRTGYSARTAGEQAARLLADVRIKAAIQAAMDKRMERLDIDADYVLNQAVKLHERCMQEIEPVLNRKGEQVHDDQGRAVFAFDAKGAAAALTLVGKHRKVGAFTEHVEIKATIERLSDAELDAQLIAKGVVIPGVGANGADS